MSLEIEKILEKTLLIHNLEGHIANSIIPSMMQRRGRLEPLQREEIVAKLFNVPPNKPGEIHELIIGEVMSNGFGLTPSLASEIADIVYYTSQTNCPDYLKDPSPLLAALGVDMDQARMFCIIKYETRLLYGDQINHKEVENSALALYLQSLK